MKILLWLLLCAAGAHAVEALRLEAVARIQSEQISECSGIVASAFSEDVYWVHNDSGDEARIFAITGDGKPILPGWMEHAGDYQGIRIGDAVNIDWEDIARDDRGNLLIGACGNNFNMRRDLAIYVIPEPSPRAASQTRVLRKLPFRYPDQNDFPPLKRNFDCEAIFWADGRIYLLSKHRSDTDTKLYRLEEQVEGHVQDLALIGRYPIGGSVTGADISADERLLAVLCYNSIHVFERALPGENWLDGPARWIPLVQVEDRWQYEAICFAGEELLVTNEQRDIFRVSLDQLVPKESASSGKESESDDKEPDGN